MQIRVTFALAACAALALISSGCATEEIPPYGDPARVVGGAGPGGSTGSGGSCTVNSQCPRSYKNDVFPILENTAKCSAMGTCHGSGGGDLTLNAGDAAGTLATLKGYSFQQTSPYIVPCDKAASKMLCNLRVEGDAGSNPYGSCGSRMPKASAGDSVDDAPLSLDQLNIIAEWIECGAPDN
jgi:hypothetical protein